MATYNPQRRTDSGGVEDVKFPISAIEGLEDTINEVNSNTIDKINLIETYYTDTRNIAKDNSGVYWSDDIAVATPGVTNVLGTDFKIPIVAGDNVELEVDEENQVVKINSTGGSGSSENSLLHVTFNTGYGSLMYDLISAITGVGGDITQPTVVSLQGYITKDLLVTFAHYGGMTYKVVTCVDLSTNTRIYDASTDNVINAVSVTVNDFLSAGTPQATEQMPQIRFTNATGKGYEEGRFSEEGSFFADVSKGGSPVSFTVEIVGGGALQVGDQLQLCMRKAFMGSIGNNYRTKLKLKKMAEYVITEEDLDKRFLTLTLSVVGAGTPEFRALFRDDTGEGAVVSPLYLRIRRPKGVLQNNDSGQTVDATFSNVVTIWKKYHRSLGVFKIL